MTYDNTTKSEKKEEKAYIRSLMFTQYHRTQSYQADK